MKKIGEFIYPWGNGHYSRMMKLDAVLPNYLTEPHEIFYFSKGEIYKKLLEKFPDKKKNIHEILMPTPIDEPFFGLFILSGNDHLNCSPQI